MKVSLSSGSAVVGYSSFFTISSIKIRITQYIILHGDVRVVHGSGVKSVSEAAAKKKNKKNKTHKQIKKPE